MPTKINRGGFQQEYVPPGNGEASGEYGDSTGSNKNFKSFKDPSKEGSKDSNTSAKTGSTVKTDTKPAVQVKPKRDISRTFLDEKAKVTINDKKDDEKTIRAGFQKMLESDAINDESREFIAQITEDGASIGFTKKLSHLSLIDNTVNINDSNTSRDSSLVLVHEFGHAADYGYLIPQDKFANKDFEYKITSYGHEFTMKTRPTLSTNYVCSDGKTMADNLFEEITPQKLKLIQADLNAEVAALEKIDTMKLYGDAKHAWAKENGYDEETLRAKGMSNYEAQSTSLRKMAEWSQANRYDKWMDDNPKIKEINRAYYDKKKDLTNQWSGMGDIYSGFNNGTRMNNCGFGHDKSYYPKMNGKKGNLTKFNISVEVFAEMGESLSGSKYSAKQAELYKKYMPKTYANYLEIRKALTSGELKTKEDKQLVNWKDYE